MSEMIDISKLQTWDKPHKVYIPSKHGVFIKRADLDQLLETAHNSEYMASPKLPSLKDVCNKVDTLEIKPKHVLQVWTAIKKLGNFG